MPKQPGRTVFIVDDERNIATSLADILKQHGFSASSFRHSRVY